MSSLLNTTAKLHLRMSLPPSATREQVISLLHDHDFVIKLDKDMWEYGKVDSPEDGGKPERDWYKVTNIMKSIPSFLSSNTVSFTCGYRNTDTGLERITYAPLGVVQESSLYVEDVVDPVGKEKNELCLVHDIVATCNRIMMGSVKSRCEESWNEDVVPSFTEALEKKNAA